MKIVNDKVKNRNELFELLDKGIEDMEQGRTYAHGEAMRIIREKVDLRCKSDKVRL